MLIEITDGPVKIDKKPILKNLRINIAGNNQYRIKTIVLENTGNEIPVDVIIYKMNFMPKVKSFSLCLNLEGIENRTRNNFRVSLSYSITSKEIDLSGTLGSHSISIKSKNTSEVIQAVSKFITHCKIK